MSTRSGRGYRQVQVPVREMGEEGDGANVMEILAKMMEEHHQREKEIAEERLQREKEIADERRQREQEIAAERERRERRRETSDGYAGSNGSVNEDGGSISWWKDSGPDAGEDIGRTQSEALQAHRRRCY